MKFLRSLLLVLFTLLPLNNVQSQSENYWSAPINISSYDQQARQPTAIADRQGWVHVIWAGTWREDNDLQEQGYGNTLYYSRWNGKTWSPPIDILIGPNNTTSFPSLAVDPYGILHLMWISDAQIFYSSALIENAASAKGWSKPAPIPSTHTAGAFIVHLQSGDDGVLHAVATEKSNLIQYITSKDNGNTWQEVSFVVASRTHYLHDPRLLIDQSGNLHILWSQYEKPNNWPPAGLYYSRSLDKGRVWLSPILISSEGAEGRGVIWERIPGEIHIIWSGTGENTGRYHRYSMNSGETWSGITQIEEIHATFGTTLHGLITDSANNLFLVSGIESIMAGEWKNSKWEIESNPISPMKPTELERYECGSINLVAATGNELFAIYHCAGDDGRSAVWVNRYQTRSPRAVADFLPRVQFATVTPILTLDYIESTEQDTTALNGDLETGIINISNNGVQSSVAAPLLIATLTPLLLIVIIAVFQVIGGKRIR